MRHSEQEIRELLYRFKQEHVIRYLATITPKAKQDLLNDLSEIDFSHLSKLYQSYLASCSAPSGKKLFTEADILVPPYSKPFHEAGEDYLREGKVGIFLVAGGQGTRLGFNGPKGCYPVTPVKRKSLFHLFAESIRAIERRYGTPLSWYIMTSRENNEETVSFFKRNAFFGLAPDQVRFIIQREIPSLDLNGNLILCRENRIFKNPNGHGGSLVALKESGVLDEMRAKGIEEVFYFQVDNPLVKIADPVFIGAHVEHQAEMSTKVVKKTDPSERVGIIGRINGKTGCIEYSELSPEEQQGRNPDGSLRFSSANIAIHMIKLSFIEELTREESVSIPYHTAIKDIECVIEQNGNLVPATISGVKFEMFIFDALTLAKNSVTMEVKREEEFAPVKNREGYDSPQTARDALVNRSIRWLTLSGKMPQLPANLVVEISPLFALDEAEFREKFSPPSSFSSPLYLGP